MARDTDAWRNGVIASECDRSKVAMGNEVLRQSLDRDLDYRRRLANKAEDHDRRVRRS